MREPLLTEREVAERLAVPITWVRNQRRYSGGPTYIKVGAHVRYDPADVAEYLRSVRHIPRDYTPRGATKPKETTTI